MRECAMSANYEEGYMPMLIPTSYQVLATCRNCANVFVYSEYDEGARYYCTLNAPKRPPCGSVGMGENTADWDDNYDAWDAWSAGREVAPNGTCNEHCVLMEKGQ